MTLKEKVLALAEKLEGDARALRSDTLTSLAEGISNDNCANTLDNVVAQLRAIANED